MEFNTNTLGTQSFQSEKLIYDLDVNVRNGIDRGEIPDMNGTTVPGLSVVKAHEGGTLDATLAGGQGYNGGTLVTAGPGIKTKIFFNLSADGSAATTGNPFGAVGNAPHGPGLNANQFRALYAGTAANNHNLTDCQVTSAFVNGRLYDLLIARGYHGSVIGLQDGEGFTTQFVFNSSASVSPGFQNQNAGTAANRHYKNNAHASHFQFSVSGIQALNQKAAGTVTQTGTILQGGVGSGVTLKTEGLSGKNLSLGPTHRRKVQLGYI